MTNNNPPPNEQANIRMGKADSVIQRYANKTTSGHFVVDEEGVGAIGRDLRATEADVSQTKQEKKNYKMIAGVSTSVLLLVLLANFGLTVVTIFLTRQFDTQGGNLVDKSSGRMVRTQSRGNTGVIEFQFQDQEDEEGRRRLDEECPLTLRMTRAAVAEGYAAYLAGTDFLYSQESEGHQRGGRVMAGVEKLNDDSCDNYSKVKVDNYPDDVVSVTCCDGEEGCCISPTGSVAGRQRDLNAADAFADGFIKYWCWGTGSNGRCED